ncbi:MAG TPA: type II toxin-antitoxin system PemK/MazF family toxin [Armatimonadetes bacterium]|nr:type II toxin-antitoxin system PemK/MazF family toxin [Armatimonadota bacterium]
MPKNLLFPNRDSVALTAQTRTIAKSRLIRRLGSLSPATMAKIDEALRITLDLR